MLYGCITMFKHRGRTRDVVDTGLAFVSQSSRGLAKLFWIQLIGKASSITQRSREHSCHTSYRRDFQGHWDLIGTHFQPISNILLTYYLPNINLLLTHY